jgi:glycosyltransferase involved in cell wall biosynthesis
MMHFTPRKILAATYHSYIDTSSGAAISLRDAIEGLAARGWGARVMSGPRLDFQDDTTNSRLFQEQAIDVKTYMSEGRSGESRMHMFQRNGVECGLLETEDDDNRGTGTSQASNEIKGDEKKGTGTAQASSQSPFSREAGEDWLNCCVEILREWRPDVLITYGGFWMTRPLVEAARAVGVRTVFHLCNYAYSDASLFEPFDVTIVPSQFHADWYKGRLGIDATVVPRLMNRDLIGCEPDPTRRFVTFVNPQPHKGLYVFAKIAQVLGRERPDIPLLVVESRAGADRLRQTGSVLRGLKNLHRMRNTSDPREFYRASHIVLMPSVWQESFGRIAAESMMNGIPVLASTRGALPEVVGDAGLLHDIPDRITPTSREYPTEDEIRPWVDSIVRLWDDTEHYRRVSEQGQTHSKRWAPHRILDDFESAILGRR